jgi:hypothetical protein
MNGSTFRRKAPAGVGPTVAVGWAVATGVGGVVGGAAVGLSWEWSVGVSTASTYRSAINTPPSTW